MATLTIEVARGPAAVQITEALPDDSNDAEALWRETRMRAHPEGSPDVRLIARDSETHRFLGVADYFRTFPPEDALFAIAVAPQERRHGVGTALLRALTQKALYNGKRNLCGFVAEDDETTWRLFRSAGIPVRVYQVKGGFYVELDLVPRTNEPNAHQSDPMRAASMCN